MRFPEDTALFEILNNHHFKKQWILDISQSNELYQFYQMCVFNKGNQLISGTEISYFEFVETHAKCCVLDYRFRFPNDRDRFKKSA